MLFAQSYLALCKPVDYSPPASSLHGDSLDKNTGVSCHAHLQGIFPTQGLNLGLPHCRQTLYRLSHQGSQKKWGKRKFEWHKHRTCSAEPTVSEHRLGDAAPSESFQARLPTPVMITVLSKSTSTMKLDTTQRPPTDKWANKVGPPIRWHTLQP